MMKIRLPERNIDKTLTLDLKASIKHYGQMQAIVLDRTGYIIDGLHRYVAMKELGRKTIKANVYDGTLSGNLRIKL